MNFQMAYSKVDYYVRYAFASIGAVLLEYVLFLLLVYIAKMDAGYANLISAVIGFVTAWIISGRTLFRDQKITPKKYAIWFAYQVVAIPMYSYLVHVLVLCRVEGFIAKIIILGFSFFINSIVFKKIISTKKLEVA